MGRYRIKAAVVAAAAALLTASGGSAVAAPVAPDATAERTAEGTANAGTPVPLPDLAFAHRRGDGGINLFRMPLSELENGYGRPTLVRALIASSGFVYDRAKVLAGDFADFTASDDGTADHVIWISRSDGGVGVWVVAGGTDTKPRQQFILRASAGWSWRNSRPMVGDVTGDGWEDLVVRQRATDGGVDVWVFPSDGVRLAAPQKWYHEPVAKLRFDDGQHVLADLDQDGRDDWVYVQTAKWRVSTPGYDGFAHLSDGTRFTADGGEPGLTAYDIFSLNPSSGFSLTNSRLLAGDVSGDGFDDLVTVVNRARGGFYVWAFVSCSPGPCVQSPTLWATVSTVGWSYAYSRQYLGDSDGDGVADLVSVHRSGNGGETIWRHVSEAFGSALSDWDSFLPQELVSDLRTGGWRWSSSRESVADTWGVVGP